MQRLSLDLPGMYGDHHVVAVREILAQTPGVGRVYASSARQRVELEFDPALTDADAIQGVLRTRGYSGESEYAPPVSSRTRALTEFVSGPAGFEEFVERVPAWGNAFGPCPGFDVLNPGDVHPADRIK